jgi:hypothetical protein
LSLIKDIGQALQDCGGASTQYGATLEQFETIAVALHQIGLIIPAATKSTSKLLDSVNAIRQRAQTSERIALGFIQKLQKHGPTLGEKASTGLYHGTFAKVKWATMVSKEAVTLHQVIEREAIAIQYLLHLLKCRLLQSI